MAQHEWVKNFPGSVTVCDPRGIILEMNDRAVLSHAEDGGERLIGANLFDCHPEPARTKVAEMFASRKTNIYTIEKKGVKKLVYQTPWYTEGVYAGFVEIEFEIPFEMPHFIRGG